MANISAVGALGLFGVLIRYKLTAFAAPLPAFPWATLLVNAVGCLAIGILFSIPESSVSPTLRLAISVGLLGGLTTMSSFAWESYYLFAHSHTLRAATYVAVTLLIAGLMVWLGARVGSIAA